MLIIRLWMLTIAFSDTDAPEKFGKIQLYLGVPSHVQLRSSTSHNRTIISATRKAARPFGPRCFLLQNFQLLTLEVVDDVVDRGVALVGLRGGALGAFWFVDLEIDACVIFHTDDAQNRADRFGRSAAPADDLAHVVFIH